MPLCINQSSTFPVNPSLTTNPFSSQKYKDKTSENLNFIESTKQAWRKMPPSLKITFGSQLALLPLAVSGSYFVDSNYNPKASQHPFAKFLGGLYEGLISETLFVIQGLIALFFEASPTKALAFFAGAATLTYSHQHCSKPLTQLTTKLNNGQDLTAEEKNKAKSWGSWGAFFKSTLLLGLLGLSNLQYLSILSREPKLKPRYFKKQKNLNWGCNFRHLLKLHQNNFGKELESLKNAFQKPQTNFQSFITNLIVIDTASRILGTASGLVSAKINPQSFQNHYLTGSVWADPVNHKDNGLNKITDICFSTSSVVTALLCMLTGFSPAFREKNGPIAPWLVLMAGGVSAGALLTRHININHNLTGSLLTLSSNIAGVSAPFGVSK